MDFDPDSGDGADYAMAAEAFLDGFDEWATERFGDDPGDRRADAELFLDWNHNYRGKALNSLARSDLDDFLLDWLPNAHAGSPDEVPAIVHAVQAVVEFLAAHEQLDGGAERSASLIAHTYDITETVGESMVSGPAKAPAFPLGEALGPDLTDLIRDSELTIEELQPLLEAQLDVFNSLPFEERKRLTDPAVAAPKQIELAFTFVPPQPAEVEASASQSDIGRMVDGFVKSATERGITLTDSGDIELVDALLLVAELVTQDDVASATTSLDLRWLTLIDDLASACGAVERVDAMIRSDGAWFDLTATEKANRLSAMVLHGGFLSSRAIEEQWQHEQRELLDDGVPHWFSVGLVGGVVLSVEEITSQALDVAAMRYHDRRSSVGEDAFDDLVVDTVGELFDGLERFGLVAWHDREPAETAESIEYGVGGSIELTALGRHVFPDLVREAGYAFDEVEGIEEATAQQMVDIAMAAGLSGADVLARWRTDLDLSSRLELVAACVMHGQAAERLIGFDIFTAVGAPAIVAPIVSQLLDSPAGAYAAAYLLDHGLAPSERVGGFIDLTPVIDMLYVSLGDPDGFDELFQTANDEIEGDLVEELWRHDLPEVAWVLEAAGELLTNKVLAKAARKAAIKHNSWLANQGR